MATDVLGDDPALRQAVRRASGPSWQRCCKRRTFPANQPVVWLGEQGDDFYIVNSGKVTVSCPDESGKEVILATLGAGAFLRRNLAARRRPAHRHRSRR